MTKPYYYGYREDVVKVCLSRCLSAPEKRGHDIDWELVDYYEVRVDIAILERMGFSDIFEEEMGGKPS